MVRLSLFYGFFGGEKGGLLHSGHCQESMAIVLGLALKGLCLEERGRAPMRSFLQISRNNLLQFDKSNVSETWESDSLAQGVQSARNEVKTP